MNREIKFRAKRADGSAWVYGDLRQENSGNKVIMTNLKTWEDNGGNVDAYGENIIVNPSTIGQYTGLKDKNKEDVYEGDILRSVRFEGIILFVAYDEEEASFMAVQINKNRGTDLESRCHITQKWLDEYPKVVIGNIHDNPELLEEDEKIAKKVLRRNIKQ